MIKVDTHMIFRHPIFLRTMKGLSQLKDWRLTVLLLCCIIFGGTSQEAFYFKQPIYFVSIAMIAWVIAEKNKYGLSELATPIVGILTAFIFLHCIYILPLPPSIWTSLEGREQIAQVFEYANTTLPWLPISLSPEISRVSLLNFLPVIAFIISLKLSASPTEIKRAILGSCFLAVISVILAVLQVADPNQTFYIYDITNFGLGVGFFSNANHQASFLVMIFPIVFYQCYLGHGPRRMIAIYGLIVLTVGIILTGSVSGYLLLAMTLAFGFITIYRKERIRSSIYILPPLFLIVLMLDFFIFGNYFKEVSKEISGMSEFSRMSMLGTSWQAGKDFGIFGFGPGSFEQVYKMYESPLDVTKFFIPNAHNDIFQMYLEFGWFGLLFLFLGLFLICTRLIEWFRNINHVSRQNTVYFICILTPLLHSFVDYPLRTMAISSVVVFYALLLDNKLVRN